MPPHLRSPYLAAGLFAAALTGAPVQAAGDSAPDTAWASGGVPVIVADGVQSVPVLTSDGAGGAIIVWQDARVFAQHLTSRGTIAPGWPQGGLPLLAGYDPRVASDGAGGAIVAWTYGLYVYCQRVRADGVQVPGWPASATTPGFKGPIHSAGPAYPSADRSSPAPMAPEKLPHEVVPTVLPDGAGGVFVAYQRLSLVSNNVVVKRLDAGGALAAGPTYLATGYRSDTEHSLCSDDSGGVIVAWAAWGGYDYDIVAQRVRRDGTIAPGWPAAAAPVCTAPGHQRATGIVEDGAGGAIIVWQDARNGTFDQVCAQRVMRDGSIAAGWPANGRPVCVYPSDPGIYRYNGSYSESFSSVAPDGAGGAFVVWSDRRDDAGDIYCQHVLPDGSLAPGWPENGIGLCAAAGTQRLPTIAADGSGGAMACWEDGRDGAAKDIYAQRITSAGALAPAWPANGLAISTSPGVQTLPRIVSDGELGAIIAWHDERNGNPDIYAGRVTGDAVVPVLASLLSAEGRPGLARLVWFAADPRGSRTTVYRREAVGDWAALATVAPDGSGRITFEDRTVLAGHRYGYRLGIFDGGAERLQGETWLDIAAAPALALSAPYPNPSSGDVYVPFALPGSERGELELVDLAGRVIEAQPLEGAGSRVMRVRGSTPLAPGVYFVRLTHAGRSLTARVAIVR